MHQKEPEELISFAFTSGSLVSVTTTGHRREETRASSQSQQNHEQEWLHIKGQTYMHGGGRPWLAMDRATDVPNVIPTSLPTAFIFALLLCLWIFLTLARKSKTPSPHYTPDELWRRNLEKRMQEATPVSADKCRSILDQLFGLDSPVPAPAKTRRLQLRRRLTEQRMYQGIELSQNRET